MNRAIFQCKNAYLKSNVFFLMIMYKNTLKIRKKSIIFGILYAEVSVR